MTVGPGIAPDLLTPLFRRRDVVAPWKCGRSRARRLYAGIPPVGIFAPPWRRTDCRFDRRV